MVDDVFLTPVQGILRLLPKSNLAHSIKLTLSQKQYLTNTVIIQ